MLSKCTKSSYSVKGAFVGLIEVLVGQRSGKFLIFVSAEKPVVLGFVKTEFNSVQIVYSVCT